MHRRISFESDGFDPELMSNPDYRGNENRFTIVIGANGSGKSQLLARIAKSFIRNLSLINDQDPLGYESQRDPTRVLALSNMVTDSFPFRSTPQGEYRYLGLRRSTSSVSTGSLSQSTIESFLDFQSDIQQQNMLTPVLRELELSSYQLAFQKSRLTNPEPEEVRDAILSSIKSFDRLRDRQVDDRAGDIDVNGLVNDIFYFTNTLTYKRREVENQPAFLRHFFDISQTYDLRPSELLRLARKAKLLEASIDLIGPAGLFPFKDLSTGQQLLLSTISRLVAQVIPGSLILIDEPEAGLHPNWQSDFVPLLKETIPAEFGCHFIIATHSPYIVADGTDVLIPGEKWGTFEPYTEPFFGRSVENILYRVFRARISGNSVVEEDLQVILEALAGISEASNSELLQRLNRLTSIAGPDTIELNRVLQEAEIRILGGSGH